MPVSRLRLLRDTVSRYQAYITSRMSDQPLNGVHHPLGTIVGRT